MSQVIHVDETNFDTEVLQSDLPVLVDFFANWCGPCKMLAPVLDKVAERMQGKVKIAKLDTDQAPNLAAKYQISGIPCLVVVKNGKEANRIVGYQSEDALVAQLENL